MAPGHGAELYVPVLFSEPSKGCHPKRNNVMFSQPVHSSGLQVATNPWSTVPVPLD